MSFVKNATSKISKGPNWDKCVLCPTSKKQWTSDAVLRIRIAFEWYTAGNEPWYHVGS